MKKGDCDLLADKNFPFQEIEKLISLLKEPTLIIYENAPILIYIRNIYKKDDNIYKNVRF